MQRLTPYLYCTVRSHRPRIHYVVCLTCEDRDTCKDWLDYEKGVQEVIHKKEELYSSLWQSEFLITGENDT